MVVTKRFNNKYLEVRAIHTYELHIRELNTTKEEKCLLQSTISSRPADKATRESVYP